MRYLFPILGIVILMAIGYGIYSWIGSVDTPGQEVVPIEEETVVPIRERQTPINPVVTIDCTRYEYFEDRMPQVLPDMPLISGLITSAIPSAYYVNTQTGERIEVDDIPDWVETDCADQIERHITY